MLRTVCLVLLVATFASAGVLPKKDNVGVKVDSLVDVGVASKGVDFLEQKKLKREANPAGLVSANVFVGGVPSYHNGYYDTTFVHRSAPVFVRAPGVHVGVGVPFGVGIGVGVFGK